MHLFVLRTASACLCRRQLPLQFRPNPKMNCGGNESGCSGRGRASIPSANFSVPQDPVMVDGPFLEALSGVKANNSPNGRQALQQQKADSNSEGHECTPVLQKPDKFSHPKRIHQVIDSTGLAGIDLKQHESQVAAMFKYEDDLPILSANAIRSRVKTRTRNLHTMRTKIEVNLEDRMEDIISVKLESSPIESSIGDDNESSLPTHFGKKDIASRGKRPKHSRAYPNKAAGTGNSDCPKDRKDDVSSVQLESLPTESSIGNDESSLPTRFGKKHMASHGKRPKHAQAYPNKALGIEKLDRSEGSPMNEPFDICQSVVRSRLSWPVKNGENQHQLEHSSECIRQILRPGMVLLKSYITHSEQIEIVKRCRELGLGPGGFYRPSFRDGAKLRLQMMCLGLDWDLETREYNTRRPVDGSKPPDIPHEFSLLVESAIQNSLSLINEEQSTDNVEDILPRMSPNICIVNFYTTSGRLGLHQDRDESRESLEKGLPVVSFSVGDSAEFLYGDHRDMEKAEKIVLESGDVLIFGGRSRHIFHGVSSIVPYSAPMALREKAKLRPGRLNLTFRQY